VRSARSFVRDTLVDWGVYDHVDDVVLMASELFTNAVLHGDGGVAVSVALDDGNVRVEVVDEGRSLPTPPRSVPSAAVTGRGLAIVATLADAWGKGRDDHGRTRVWLEVPRV
jgi:anti-sigma regulatory factor (Ser/Thr protein kinase)